MLPLGLSVAEKVLKIVIAAGKAADGDVSLDDATKLVDAGKTWLGLVDEVTKREPAAARALKEALAGRIDGMLASPEHRDHAHDRASRYEQALERCMPEPKALRAALLGANLDAARAGREGAALMLARARDEVPAKLAPYLAEGQADAAFFAEVTEAALTLFFGDRAYFERLGRAVQGAALERLERIEGKLDAIPDATVAKLLAALDARTEAKAEGDPGVPRAAVIALAKRVAADVEDAGQALRELERAVEIAASVREEGAHGSNLGAFVDDVLRRLADLTAAGRLDEASREADGAFADWERAEEARREAAQAAGLRLLEAGLAQDLLRRDAKAAAAKVAKRVELETPDPTALFGALRAAQGEWYFRGRDGGLNLDLAVSVGIARIVLDLAAGADERGAAQTNLGNALRTLGERESETARLEEAVDAHRAALEELTRERVPLYWAKTQNNLGNALAALGYRESGTARLEEAVDAHRAALEECTRERVPLDWATMQTNLGAALMILGEGESGTARLEEAVAAYRAALEECTRERVPLDWAGTQNNLGNALAALGERESGTALLEEAVDAYRAALEECTRERVPLDWATTQHNLGNALRILGERESGTGRLEEAVAAYRAALEERTRERVPLGWATTQNNLGNALAALGERESGTARLEEAVAAYRAALEECTRERVPYAWAQTEENLGLVLTLIVKRSGDIGVAEEAVSVLDGALVVFADGGAQSDTERCTRALAAARALRDRLAGG